MPLGESREIKLTRASVLKYLVKPTRSGKLPTEADVMGFMMLCRSRELNPFAQEAFLVGYDTKDGPQFSLIVAHQAYIKRAQLCPEFAGMESGVVVQTKEGKLEDIEGDLVPPGTKLIGGWAKVYRLDRKVPSSERLSLDVYNTGRSRWASDPAGQIVKCAEASALRKSFPSHIGGTYTREEMEQAIDPPAFPTGAAQPLDELEGLLAKPKAIDINEPQEWPTRDDSQPPSPGYCWKKHDEPNPAHSGPDGEMLFDNTPEYA